MNLDLVRGWIAGVTGLVLAGEAALLVFGMSRGDPTASTWLQASYVQLGADVVLGVALFVLAFKPWDGGYGWALSVAAAVVVVTHVLRAYHYLTGAGDAFLFNGALFWINNAKILGAAAVLALGLRRAA